MYEIGERKGCLMSKAMEQNYCTEMYKSILKLESVEQCRRFFLDLCSPAELSAMEQRYMVAKMLYEGKVYTEIGSEIHASSATISRVKRMLTSGEDGLREIFDQERKEKGL